MLLKTSAVKAELNFTDIESVRVLSLGGPVESAGDHHPGGSQWGVWHMDCFSL